LVNKNYYKENSYSSLNQSHNISQDQDNSIHNSIDDNNNIHILNNINNGNYPHTANKKRANHFKDPKINAHQKDESPSYMSPTDKKYANKIIINKREDSVNKIPNNWNDFLPLTKKKDLNVFLNDRVKYRNGKKIPFK
jgi:hypothetical protein